MPKVSLPEPYWTDGKRTIFLGDCREILPLLEPIDLVLTDPPYPNFAKGFQVTPIAGLLDVLSCRQFVFWDAKQSFPLSWTAVHIWHKPNGNSSEHYERIFERNGKATCRVFREAAILPNYVQFRKECVDHPTQKPVKLVLSLLYVTKEIRILDPFMGSGTTLVAARDLDRECIGIEIEERYCEIAAKRLEAPPKPTGFFKRTPKGRKREQPQEAGFFA